MWSASCLDGQGSAAGGAFVGGYAGCDLQQSVANTEYHTQAAGLAVVPVYEEIRTDYPFRFLIESLGTRKVALEIRLMMIIEHKAGISPSIHLTSTPRSSSVYVVVWMVLSGTEMAKVFSRAMHLPDFF